MSVARNPALFMSGQFTDHKGRKVRDYWRQNDDWLETTHDYIQWAFPLPLVSAYNPVAPLLTEADARYIREDKSAAANFDRCIFMMHQFYTKTDKWLAHEDHNHQRITRILKCMRLIVPHNGYDLDFFKLIMERSRKGRGISTISKAHWFTAIAPTTYTFDDALSLSKH